MVFKAGIEILTNYLGVRKHARVHVAIGIKCHWVKLICLHIIHSNLIARDVGFKYQATLGRYKAAIERTRNIGNRTVPIKFWNVDTRLPGTASIRFSVNSYQAQLTSQMISHASVAGKSSPLVLAADITANHLLHHLQTLPSDARLNAPSSIADWELQPCVWGVSQNAIDDIL